VGAGKIGKTPNKPENSSVAAAEQTTKQTHQYGTFAKVRTREDGVGMSGHTGRMSG